jgi:peptidoglycan/xylan/chitin deacetylase (PgdA/CDA1 family)
MTRVALTFDAEHPSRPARPGNAERLLDVLERERVRATFFVQGRWATAYPEVARRIAAAGHVVGNHSRSHAPMTALTDDGIRRSVRECERIVGRITGADTRPWFRCPYGEGAHDARVLGVLDGLGYRNVHWDVDTRDWDEERGGAEVAAAALAAVEGAADAAVVLLHTWPDATVAAIEPAIGALRQADAELVAVDAL